MRSLCEMQLLLLEVKKAPDEDTLKSTLAKVSFALPLVDELAAALSVACEDLDKASKERDRRQKKAQRAAKADAKRAEKKVKVAEETKLKQSVGQQKKNTNTTIKDLVPFTAPQSMGSVMHDFKTWADATGAVTSELLQKPFMVSDADEVGEFLVGEQCAPSKVRCRSSASVGAWQMSCGRVAEHRHG